MVEDRSRHGLPATRSASSWCVIAIQGLTHDGDITRLIIDIHPKWVGTLYAYKRTRHYCHWGLGGRIGGAREITEGTAQVPGGRRIYCSAHRSGKPGRHTGAAASRCQRITMHAGKGWISVRTATCLPGPSRCPHAVVVAPDHAHEGGAREPLSPRHRPALPVGGGDARSPCHRRDLDRDAGRWHERHAGCTCLRRRDGRARPRGCGVSANA